MATPVGAATAAKEAGQPFSRSSSRWAVTSAVRGSAATVGVYLFRNIELA